MNLRNVPSSSKTEKGDDIGDARKRRNGTVDQQPGARSLATKSGLYLRYMTVI